MRLIFYPQLFFAASAVAGSIAAVRTIDGSAILQKPDLMDIKSKTTVTRGFLTKTQARSYLLRDIHYDRRPECPGCVHQSAGNYVRERGIINVPQSFVRRLVDIGSGGDEQCSLEEYELSFSPDMPIYASRVNGTTDAHIDVDSKTKKLPTHHVAVVFLNTVEGAKFVVGDESFDIEEGTFISFPGGWVRHHIVMKRGSGWVTFLGPVQLDGNHGFVGSEELRNYPTLRTRGLDQGSGSWSWSVSEDTTFKTGHGRFKPGRRLEESEVTNYSSAVIGDIFVTGYTNATGLNGDKNETLHLQWDLEGLYTDCGMKSCFHVEIKDDPTFCDNVAIGQLQSDAHKRNSEGDGESDDGNHIILKNISHTEVTRGEGRVNVGKPIDHLLNYPVVVHGHDGAVLACDILTEITVPRNFSDSLPAAPVDGTIAEVEGSSGAGASIISFGLVVAFVGAVASFSSRGLMLVIGKYLRLRCSLSQRTPSSLILLLPIKIAEVALKHPWWRRSRHTCHTRIIHAPHSRVPRWRIHHHRWKVLLLRRRCVVGIGTGGRGGVCCLLLSWTGSLSDLD